MDLSVDPADSILSAVNSNVRLLRSQCSKLYKLKIEEESLCRSRDRHIHTASILVKKLVNKEAVLSSEVEIPDSPMISSSVIPLVSICEGDDEAAKFVRRVVRRAAASYPSDINISEYYHDHDDNGQDNVGYKKYLSSKSDTEILDDGLTATERDDIVNLIQGKSEEISALQLRLSKTKRETDAAKQRVSGLQQLMEKSSSSPVTRSSSKSISSIDLLVLPIDGRQRSLSHGGDLLGVLDLIQTIKPSQQPQQPPSINNLANATLSSSFPSVDSLSTSRGIGRFGEPNLKNIGYSIFGTSPQTTPSNIVSATPISNIDNEIAMVESPPSSDDDTRSSIMHPSFDSGLSELEAVVQQSNEAALREINVLKQRNGILQEQLSKAETGLINTSMSLEGVTQELSNTKKRLQELIEENDLLIGETENLKKLKNQNVILSKQIEEKTCENASLLEDVERVNDYMKECTEAYNSNMENINNEMQSKLDDANLILESVSKDWQFEVTKRENLESELFELKEGMDSLRMESSRIVQQLEDANKDLLNTTTKLRVAEERNQKLSLQNSDLLLQISSLNDLKDSYERLNNENIALKNQIEENFLVISSISKDWESEKLLNETLEYELNISTDELNSCRSEKEKLSRELNESKEEIITLSLRLDDSSQRHRKAMDDCLKEMNECKKEVVYLQQQVNETLLLNQQVQEEQNANLTQVSQLDTNLRNLEARMDETDRLYCSVLRDVDDLRDTTTSAAAMLLSMEQQLRAADVINASLKEDLETTKGFLEQSESAFSDISKRNRMLGIENNSLHLENEALKLMTSTVDDLRRQIEVKTCDLASLEYEAARAEETAQSALNAAEEQITELTETSEILNLQIDTARSEFENERKVLMDQLSQLRDNLEKLQFESENVRILSENEKKMLRDELEGTGMVLRSVSTDWQVEVEKRENLEKTCMELESSKNYLSIENEENKALLTRLQAEHDRCMGELQACQLDKVAVDALYNDSSINLIESQNILAKTMDKLLLSECNVEDLIRQVETKAVSLAEVEHNLSRANEALRNLTDLVSSRTGQLEALEDEYRQYKEENLELKDRLEDALRALDTTTTALALSETTVINLGEEVKCLKEKEKLLLDKISLADVSLNKMENYCRGFDSTYGQVVEDIRSIRLAIGNVVSTLSTLYSNLETNRLRISSLTCELDQTNMEFGQSKKLLAQMSGTMEELLVDNRNLKSEINNKESIEDALNAVVEEFGNKVSRMEQDISNLHSQVEIKTCALAQTEMDFTEYKQSVEASIQEMQVSLDEADDALVAAVDEKAKALEALESERLSFQSQFDDNSLLMKSLSDDWQNEFSKRTEAESELAVLRYELSLLEDKLKESQDALISSNNSLDQNQDRLKALTTHNVELVETIDFLNETVAAAHRNVQTVLQRNVDLEKLFESKSTHMTLLQTGIDNMTESIERLTDSLKQSNKERDDMSIEISDLRYHLLQMEDLLKNERLDSAERRVFEDMAEVNSAIDAIIQAMSSQQREIAISEARCGQLEVTLADKSKLLDVSEGAVSSLSRELAASIQDYEQLKQLWASQYEDLGRNELSLQRRVEKAEHELVIALEDRTKLRLLLAEKSELASEAVTANEDLEAEIAARQALEIAVTELQTTLKRKDVQLALILSMKHSYEDELNARMVLLEALHTQSDRACVVVKRNAESALQAVNNIVASIIDGQQEMSVLSKRFYEMEAKGIERENQLINQVENKAITLAVTEAELARLQSVVNLFETQSAEGGSVKHLSIAASRLEADLGNQSNLIANVQADIHETNATVANIVEALTVVMLGENN